MTIKAMEKRNSYWMISLLMIILAAIYWGALATDRYVSESNVVLESPQIATPELAFGSLFSSGLGGSAGDMLLLRDYLLSIDMMQEIDEKLNFREHFSNKEVDILSRLWDVDAPLEELHEYYLRMISVELDDYAKVLRIGVRAFDPEMAQNINKTLLASGERHMNRLGQRLAEEQVRFLERQVSELSSKFEDARADLIEYQNKHGLASPSGVVESIGQLVAKLEGELATLKAKRAVLASFQSANSADMKRVGSEIAAIQNQISQERGRMAQQSGMALNVVSSEFQTLELKLRFAQDSYSGALAALQNTRIEAARQLKQVSVLQSPSLPEYPLEPARLYNIVVFAIVAMFLAFIFHMLVLIIREHKD